MHEHSQTSGENPAEDVILGIYVEISQMPPVTTDGKLDTYLYNLSEKYAGSSTLEMLNNTAALISPVTEQPYVADSTNRAIDAFYRGGLMGLRVAESFLGADSTARIGEKRLRVADVSHRQLNKRDGFEKIASSIIELGAAGFEEAGDYHDFLEELEDELSPDARMQTYMRRGFGLVMHQANLIYAEKQQRAYEDDIAALSIFLQEEYKYHDWDADFQQLLRED